VNNTLKNVQYFEMGMCSTKFKRDASIPGRDNVSMAVYSRLCLTDMELTLFYRLFIKLNKNPKTLGVYVDVRDIIAGLNVERNDITERMFSIFNADKSNKLNLCEFVCALWHFLSMDEKLLPEFVFTLYDHRHYHALDITRMRQLFETLHGDIYEENAVVRKHVDALTVENSDNVALENFISYTSSNPDSCAPIVKMQAAMRSWSLGTYHWRVLLNKRKEHPEQMDVMFFTDINAMIRSESQRIKRENSIRILEAITRKPNNSSSAIEQSSRGQSTASVPHTPNRQSINGNSVPQKPMSLSKPRNKIKKKKKKRKKNDKAAEIDLSGITEATLHIRNNTDTMLQVISEALPPETVKAMTMAQVEAAYSEYLKANRMNEIVSTGKVIHQMQEQIDSGSALCRADSICRKQPKHNIVPIERSASTMGHVDALPEDLYAGRAINRQLTRTQSCPSVVSPCNSDDEKSVEYFKRYPRSKLPVKLKLPPVLRDRRGIQYQIRPASVMLGTEDKIYDYNVMY